MARNSITRRTGALRLSANECGRSSMVRFRRRAVYKPADPLGLRAPVGVLVSVGGRRSPSKSALTASRRARTGILPLRFVGQRTAPRDPRKRPAQPRVICLFHGRTNNGGRSRRRHPNAQNRMLGVPHGCGASSSRQRRARYYGWKKRLRGSFVFRGHYRALRFARDRTPRQAQARSARVGGWSYNQSG